MAPPNSRSFSVNVVLPASGCEMIAKVRRRSTSVAMGDRAGVPSGARMGMFMAGWMWHFRPPRSSFERRASLEASLPAISHYLLLGPRLRQLSVRKDDGQRQQNNQSRSRSKERDRRKGQKHFR